jgi:Pyridoxal-phosphate dependent enzyme
MTAFPVPDLADVLAARQRIAPYLSPTPLYRYPALDALAGAQVWVKHENHQPVGAFKVRGGVNLISQLAEDERRRGVIAAGRWRSCAAAATSALRSSPPYGPATRDSDALLGRRVGYSVEILVEDLPEHRLAGGGVHEKRHR